MKRNKLVLKKVVMKMNNAPQIFYKKLEQNFEKRGYINLEQKEVNSKQDLVEISNIFNSKRYELFRIVYLKDNKIKNNDDIRYSK